MGRSRSTILGMASTALALVACGHPAPVADDPAGLTRRGTPAQRYQVLQTTPICTPTPGCTNLTGTGIFNTADTICFTVVDNGSADSGGLIVKLNGVDYGGSIFGNAVTFTNNVATISATVTDNNANAHTVAVSWSYDVNGAKTISVDNGPALAITGFDQGVFPGQCEPANPTCVAIN